MRAADLSTATSLLLKHNNAASQLAALNGQSTIIVRSQNANGLEFSANSEVGRQIRALARRHLENTIADLTRRAAQIGLSL